MKAQKIYENINFERTQDPIASLGIGERGTLIKKFGRGIGEAIYHLKPWLDEYEFEIAYEDGDELGNHSVVVFTKPSDSPDDLDEIEITSDHGRGRVQFLPKGYAPNKPTISSIYNRDDIKKINQKTFWSFFGSPKKYNL